LNRFVEKGFHFFVINHDGNIIPVEVETLVSLKGQDSYLDIKIVRKIVG